MYDYQNLVEQIFYYIRPREHTIHERATFAVLHRQTLFFLNIPFIPQIYKLYICIQVFQPYP